MICILVNKGKLYIKDFETFQVINLAEYGYDYRKPLQKMHNHMFQKDLIRKIRQIINSQRTLFEKLFQRDKICIGVESISTKIEIDHYCDFAEIIGNNPIIILKEGIDFKNLKIENIFKKLHYGFIEVKYRR